jgi:hypothetical protein
MPSHLFQPVPRRWQWADGALELIRDCATKASNDYRERECDLDGNKLKRSKRLDAEAKKTVFVRVELLLHSLSEASP